MLFNQSKDRAEFKVQAKNAAADSQIKHGKQVDELKYKFRDTKVKPDRNKEVIMNPIDKDIDMQTKWVGLKAKISELGRKLASPRFQERREFLRHTQDLNMPMVGIASGNEYPTDRTPQEKKRDNDFVDMHAKYVLRLRLSWTGLYGKSPWPREQKQWEKV